MAHYHASPCPHTGHRRATYPSWRTLKMSFQIFKLFLVCHSHPRTLNMHIEIITQGGLLKHMGLLRRDSLFASSFAVVAGQTEKQSPQLLAATATTEVEVFPSGPYIFSFQTCSFSFQTCNDECDEFADLIIMYFETLYIALINNSLGQIQEHIKMHFNSSGTWMIAQDKFEGLKNEC